jgi:hypothetical protein
MQLPPNYSKTPATDEVQKELFCDRRSRLAVTSCPCQLALDVGTVLPATNSITRGLLVPHNQVPGQRSPHVARRSLDSSDRIENLDAS